MKIPTNRSNRFVIGAARHDTQSAAVSHKIRNNTLLLRQRLRLELVKRIRPGVVSWGRNFVGYVEQENGVDVMLASGEVFRCPCLVGANGIY